MEYFVGSVITLITILMLNKYSREKISTPATTIRYSQTRVFEMMRGILMDMFTPSKSMPSQSSIYQQKIEKRIAFVDDQAYWIFDNCFYMAPIVNDEIDFDAAKQVDTMSMDKVQLDKMFYIIEQLREGLTNDNWNSGEQEI